MPPVHLPILHLFASLAGCFTKQAQAHDAVGGESLVQIYAVPQAVKGAPDREQLSSGELWPSLDGRLPETDPFTLALNKSSGRSARDWPVSQDTMEAAEVHTAGLLQLPPGASYPDWEARKLLHARSRAVSNRWIVVVAAITLAPLIAGCVVGSKHLAPATASIANALWVPGLVCVALRNIVLVLNIPTALHRIAGRHVLAWEAHDQPIHAADVDILLEGGATRQKVLEKSALAYFHYLWDKGGHLPALLCAFLHFLVPVVISAAFCKYWCSLRSRSPASERTTGVVAQALRILSMWPFTTAFVFLLIYHMLNGLQKPPLLQTVSCLDLGWTCYVAYCLLTALASNLVQEPGVTKGNITAPFVLRYCGRRGVAAAATILAGTWVPFFVVGISRPCVSLVSDDSRLMSPQVASSTQASELRMPSESTAAGARMSASTMTSFLSMHSSVVEILRDLWQWFFASGDLNMLIGALLVLLCGMACTALSVVALLREGLCQVQRFSTSKPKQRGSLAVSLRTILILRHLATTSELVVGFALAVLTMRVHNSRGLFMHIEVGLLFLFLSEVVHTLLFWIVFSTAEFDAVQMM